MIERDVRLLAPIALACLLVGAAPAPVPPAEPIEWESDARALSNSRLMAEDAFARLVESGATSSGATREAAVKAMESLLAAADAYQTRADAMTPRLNAPGMPPAANDRHGAFVASHRARRAQLAALLPALRSGTPSAAASDALALLADASGGPPRDAASSIAVRHVRRIAPRTASADFSDLDDVRLADGVSPPRDLAVAPKSIQDAAAKMPAAWTAERVAAWVRADIEDVPFHASTLGAAGCLRDRRCGAFDSASLLASLLRARKIPARLAYGVVEADGSVLARTWLGGGDRQEVVDALHLGGVPAEEAGNARVRFEHVWVRARVGEAWVDLDPVLDPSPAAPPGPSPAAALAASADPAALLVRYLSDPSERTPMGANFLPPLPPKATQKRGVKPVASSKKPGPPVILRRDGDLFGVPAAYRSVVGLSAGRSGGEPWIEVRVPLEDVQRTGLLFYPAPPSELEGRIAKALGGSWRIPPHLTTATTRVSAGGREIAALPPLAWGTVVSLTITLFPPNGNPIDAHGAIQTGAPASLTVVPHAPGAGWLPGRWREADEDPTRGAGVARFCAAIGAQFFADLLDETARLATRAGGRRFVSPSTVLVAGALDAPSGLARPPLFADAAGLTVDVGRLDELLLPAPGSQPVAFEVAAGAALSSWEARALEIATGVPAASTVTAAKAAATTGAAPKILRGNATASDLGSLSPYARAEVRRGLANGLVAVVPRAPTAIGGWAGESYVLLDARSGRGAYLLRGSLRGAITTDRLAALLDPIREGGDAGTVMAAWRRGRAERALLAREGWPSGTTPAKVAGVANLLAASASRVNVEPLAVGPWPPVGGKAKILLKGEPIALSGVGPVLWLGRGSRVLDPAVVRWLGKDLPKGFDPATRLWVGPSAMAVVPVDGEGRLLPVPARY